MRLFRLPKSPMSVLPGAKQIKTIWFVLAGFLVVSGVICVLAGREGRWLILAECVLSAAAAVFHVRTFCRKAVGSVMSFFPTTCLLVAVRVLFKLIGIPSQLRLWFGSEIGFAISLAIPILFWAGFCLCTYFALMGKAKLMLPLAMLLFAFFYIFVEVNLRSFLEIARLILFLLLLWMPIDAVCFTSAPGFPGSGDEKPGL